MIKEINYRGINLKIVSKASFAKIINRSKQTLYLWIAKGIIPQPTFMDKSVNKGGFLADYSYTGYYTMNEALEVRDIIAKHGLVKGKEITSDIENEIKSSILALRERIKTGDPKLIEYPLILKFKGYDDALNYFNRLKNYDSPESLVQELYKKGDRL